jgi:hypothetical protein
LGDNTKKDFYITIKFLLKKVVSEEQFKFWGKTEGMVHVLCDALNKESNGQRKSKMKSYI